jgi:hypothetical protein
MPRRLAPAARHGHRTADALVQFGAIHPPERLLDATLLVPLEQPRRFRIARLRLEQLYERSVQGAALACQHVACEPVVRGGPVRRT